jgi:hypothetical protein
VTFFLITEQTDAGVHVCLINKLWRKLNGKSKMENPETLTPLGTQDTGPQKHNINTLSVLYEFETKPTLTKRYLEVKFYKANSLKQQSARQTSLHPDTLSRFQANHSFPLAP